MSVDYSSLLKQLESLESDSSALSQVPDDLRERLSNVARLVSVKLERPAETLTRLLVSQPAEQACVRVAADLNLFHALASGDDQPKPVDQLADATACDPSLLKRLLRILAANGAVLEKAEGYTTSPSFGLLSDTHMAQAFGPCQDWLEKNYTSLPKFLRNMKYREPPSPTDTVVQWAWVMPGRHGMDIIVSDPERLKAFSVLMSAWEDGSVHFHSQYPVESRIGASFDKSRSDVILVDVGGGFGQKSIALKKAFPTMPGRIIVQDLPHIINIAPRPDPSLGIELAAHDFFDEQPVKGAKVYYLRQVLHTRADEQAGQALRRLRDTMTPGYSVLLIHELVISARNAGRWVASQDFEMLSQLASGEHTEELWKQLCISSGFSKIQFFLGASDAQEAVIEVQI